MTIPVSPWAIVSWISRGHALPLVEHAGLAGLCQQLGVQAGVLLERRLEPRHGQAPLLALLGHPLAEQHATPDRERLDDDDRHADRPPLRVRREPADHRVDEDRRGEDAGDRRPATAAAPMAWKNPVIRKMKKMYSRDASADAITSRPMKYTIIRSWCALRGCGARV